MSFIHAAIIIVLNKFRKITRYHLEHLRVRLSGADAKLIPAVLGLLVGLLSAGVILLFRSLIDLIQAGFLPDGNIEHYEGLDPVIRLLLPLGSALIIGLLFLAFSRGRFVVGIVNVIERLAYFQGQLGWHMLLVQFFGGILAIVGGHSVGREGPSVHLGAAASSLLGQYFQVPNNILRILVACGSAAAISASFNTPLAGVIFAMEVIMLEYSLGSFIPVILAAFSASGLTILAYGDQTIFQIPTLEMSSLKEIPVILLLGILAGVVSSLMIIGLKHTASFSRNWHFMTRLLLAGSIIGLIALPFPEVMSIGYDTVSQAMLGEIGLGLLVGILVFKLLATITSIGLGIPAGVIGPALFIGAMLGGATGLVASHYFPGITSTPGFYALLGLGAMMAGLLQAPLAALMAMLEMTSNPEIIFPGMLVVVIAELTRSELFNQPSVFRMLLQARGLDYRANPVAQHLHRMGVASIMEKNFVRLPVSCDLEKLKAAMQEEPKWLLLENEGVPESLMPGVDLARYLTEQKENPDESENEIKLNEVPAERLSIQPLHQWATLHEAAVKLDEHKVDALYIYDTPAPNLKRVTGILLKEQVQSAYQF